MYHYGAVQNEAKYIKCKNVEKLLHILNFVKVTTVDINLINSLQYQSYDEFCIL